MIITNPYCEKCKGYLGDGHDCDCSYCIAGLIDEPRDEEEEKRQ